MKKVYYLIIAVLSTVAAWSQTTYNWQGANGASWTVPTNWASIPAGNPRFTPSVADRLVFNTGTALTITNVPNQTIGRMTVASGSITLVPSAAGNTLNITNTSAPAFVVQGDLTTGLNIVLGNDVDAEIDGTFTVNSGVEYNTSGTANPRPNTIVSATGIIQNSGAVTSNTAARLTINNGGTYIHAQNGGEIPLALWADNSNCIVTGITNTIPTAASFAQEFGNFTWNCPSQGIIGNPNLNGLLTNIDGNFTMASTGTGRLYLVNNGDFTLLISGNYIQTGGTLVINQAGGTGEIVLEGSFSMSGGTLVRNSSSGGGNSSTIFFDGAAVQSFTKTGGTISGVIDFEVQPGTTINFGTSVLDGSTGRFRLRSGAKIITANPNGLYTTGALGSVQTMTRLFNTGSDYEFRGASTGVFHTGSNALPSNVRNLTINNATGNVTLSKSITVTPGGNKLYLQNGILITSATNMLTLNDNVIATGVAAQTANVYNNNSYVSGPMTKVGNDAFIFPVGKIGTGMVPIGINNVGTNNSFTAEYQRQTPPNKDNLTPATYALVKRISSCEYWDLTRSNGTTPISVTLYWNANSPCGADPYITNPSTIRAVHYNSGLAQWDDASPTFGTGSPASGSVTWSGVNAFSPFALGTSNSADNPLPVVFADVKAYEKNGGVQIEWSNLTEKDVAIYHVERSANGQDFSSIGRQLPSSNQNDRADYNAFDANPINGVNYYRIRAEETTGKIVYSKILSVNMGNGMQGLRIYPNPVSGNQVNLSLSNVQRGVYTVRIFNTSGQDIFNKTINNNSTTIVQTLDLPATVKAGVYNLLITGKDYRETRTFIVQ